jgi:hypothetical protein
MNTNAKNILIVIFIGSVGGLLGGFVIPKISEKLIESCFDTVAEQERVITFINSAGVSIHEETDLSGALIFEASIPLDSGALNVMKIYSKNCSLELLAQLKAKVKETDANEAKKSSQKLTAFVAALKSKGVVVKTSGNGEISVTTKADPFHPLTYSADGLKAKDSGAYELAVSLIQ